MKKHIWIACLMVSGGAQAGVEAAFDEGAPKDRFTITSTDTCPYGALSVTIDLTGSAGGLIFDVTGSGAGVSVYQPFEVVAGSDLLSAAPVVRDGDTVLTLNLTGLGPGQQVSFTIDVDDTRGASQTVVSGSEIAGSTIRTSGSHGVRSGEFGSNAVANIGGTACLS